MHTCLDIKTAFCCGKTEKYCDHFGNAGRTRKNHRSRVTRNGENWKDMQPSKALRGSSSFTRYIRQGSVKAPTRGFKLATSMGRGKKVGREKKAFILTRVTANVVVYALMNTNTQSCTRDALENTSEQTKEGKNQGRWARLRQESR